MSENAKQKIEKQTGVDFDEVRDTAADVFLDERHLAADEVARGAVSQGYREVVKSIDQSERSQYRTFLGKFKKEIPDEVLKDAEFEATFEDTLDFEAKPSSKYRKFEQYGKVKSRLKAKIDRYFGPDREAVKKNWGDAVFDRRDLLVSKKILSLADAKPELAGKFYYERRELEIRRSRGEISREEYLKKRSEITAEAVAESGDKELQQQWEEYENESGIEITLDDNTNIPLQNDEVEVTHPDELKKAYAEVSASGMSVKMNDDGSASVLVDGDFNVEVVLRRNLNTNVFVYLVKDPYAAEGFTRSNEADFLKTLDRRHIDAYLTEKIGILPEDPSSVNDVPDNDLIDVGERLLSGNAKDRGYGLSSENRQVLDKFADLLRSDDEKYPTIGSKVEMLKNFLVSEHNAEIVRRKLMTGRFKSVEDVIM